MLVTLFVIASMTFFLMKLMPGSPVKNREKLTPDMLAQIEKQYGLDKPVPVQYMSYMKNLVKGDLGTSFQGERKVVDVIGDRISPSFRLGVQALLFGTAVGIMLGIIAALRHNTWVDYLATVIAVLGVSIPGFVFASVLKLVFAVKLGWFPIAYWPKSLFEDFDKTVLPTIALSVFVIATVARFMRTELLDVFGSDYITLARAKGITKPMVVIKHAVRNALIPVITILGPLAAGVLVGTLVIERIFVIPGLGEQFVVSVTLLDYPTIMGLALFYSMVLIVAIFIVDMLYGIVDPRIRVSGGKS